MSSLKYSSYPGWGTLAAKEIGYSQAVRVGDRIETSGQGGWDPNLTSLSDLKFPNDIREEIAQAFANVDLNLRDAGGKGWSQVFRVNSYHTVLNDEVNAIMKEQFEKWMPEHKPIWTEVGVTVLGGGEAMRVEIEVVAWDPK